MCLGRLFQIIFGVFLMLLPFGSGFIIVHLIWGPVVFLHIWNILKIIFWALLSIVGVFHYYFYHLLVGV